MIIMLARAMVKEPQLLILDEPCQGLDRTHRRGVLGLLDLIGSKPNTQLIFVIHYPHEIPSCTTHILSLNRSRGEVIKTTS